MFLASGITPGHEYVLKFLLSCLSDTHPENSVKKYFLFNLICQIHLLKYLQDTQSGYAGNSASRLYFRDSG